MYDFDLKLLDPDNLDIELRLGSSITWLYDLANALIEQRQADAAEYDKMLRLNPSIRHKRGLYVPENYIFIERINMIPFKETNKLLDLFQIISPDMFKAPVKYASQIVQCSLDECMQVAPGRTYQPGEFWKCHYALDIMQVGVSLVSLVQIWQNYDHHAQNVWFHGAATPLNAEVAATISENARFTQPIRYLQLFFGDTSPEFISSLLSANTKFDNLKLIEIKYSYSELGSLFELFEQQGHSSTSFPSLTSLVMINRNTKYSYGMHDPHQFDVPSLDTDLFTGDAKTSTNLFQIAATGDFELEHGGKRYKVQTSGSHFKLFGTNLLPNAGDYIELVVDTLFEYKIGSVISQVKTSDTISDEYVTARVPFANVVEISWTVHRPDFITECDNYSFALNAIKRSNSSAKWSLKIETRLTRAQSKYDVEQ